MSYSSHLKERIIMGLASPAPNHGGYAIDPRIVRDWGPDFGLDRPGIISQFTTGTCVENGGSATDTTFAKPSASTPFGSGGFDLRFNTKVAAQNRWILHTPAAPIDITHIVDSNGWLGLHIYVPEGGALKNLTNIFVRLTSTTGNNLSTFVDNGGKTPGYCFVGKHYNAWSETGTFDPTNITKVEILFTETGSADYDNAEIGVHALVGGMQLKMVFGFQFDDSNQNQFNIGFRDHDAPLKYGMRNGIPVTIGLITNQIDDPGTYPGQLTWAECRQMQAAGIGFSIHGDTAYTSLGDLGVAHFASSQSLMAANGITEKNATRLTTYPNGRVNGGVISAMRGAGIIAGRMIGGVTAAGTYPNEYWGTYQPPYNDVPPGTLASQWTVIQQTPPHPYFWNSPGWGNVTTADAKTVIDNCIATGGGLLTPYLHNMYTGTGGTDGFLDTEYVEMVDYVKTKIDSGEAIGADMNDAYQLFWGYSAK